MVQQFYSSDNLYLITVGENAKENDTIRRQAAQSDLWFHLQDVASPHVILSPLDRTTTSSFSSESIHQAALLCKAFSKQKSLQTSNVIYLPRKHVKGVVEIDGRVEVKGHAETIKVYRDDTIRETLKKKV
ncbi:hypothetical protein C9374_011756 [Naegleria lovaniensis]|uniref:NFACT RNA-binding domain-containing protein n=1 Tax=Naegleria lovaniensis TaxID=51637 RepID=A0AA88GCC9_NAELO|nr:uncharacterized protein C9374_011756 [Naegleria lovaniensis]KAG2373871.1 hypothetical protein C9374_011756 [Naegleria lovaniensis]